MIALVTTLRDLAADPEPTCRRLAAVADELEPRMPNTADALRRGRLSPEALVKLADELEAA